jgi:hypothetical protein
MENPTEGQANSGEQVVRIAWEVPETVEVDLGLAQTANTSSNFDGTNYSS